MARLFESFGEFDSAEEINRAALAQKAEGDTEAVLQIAKENGIDREDAQAFIDGEEEELCNPLTAAFGKLNVEAAYLHFEGVMEDWLHEIQEECAESEEMRINVRKKGNSLAGYIAELVDASYKNKTVVSREISAKCSKEVRDIMGTHQLTIGATSIADRRKLMHRYYGRKH